MQREKWEALPAACANRALGAALEKGPIRPRRFPPAALPLRTPRGSAASRRRAPSRARRVSRRPLICSARKPASAILPSVSVSRCSCAPAAFDGQNQLRCIGRKQFLEVRRVREERRRVAVASHAEHGDVERPRQLAECVPGERRRFCAVVGPLIERHELSRRRRSLQQFVRYQLCVGARRGRRHQPLVDQCDDHLLPIDLGFRKFREKKRRRRAAGDGDEAGASFGDGVGELAGDRLRERLRQFRPAREDMHFVSDWHAGQPLSCQVRPSRSISAIEADGPQVPAV